MFTSLCSDQSQPPVENSKPPAPSISVPVENSTGEKSSAEDCKIAEPPVKNSEAIHKPESDVTVKKTAESSSVNSKPEIVNDTEKSSSEKDSSSSASKKPITDNNNAPSHLQKPPPLPMPEGDLEAVLKPTKPKSNSDSVANGHIPQGSPGGNKKQANNNNKQEEAKVTVSLPNVTETNFAVKKDPKDVGKNNSVSVTKEVPEIPESNFVVVPGDNSKTTESVISDRSADKTASNDKDFSQTAPWRVSQRKRESSGEQPSPPIPDADPIHPWRKSKQDSTGGARPKEFSDTAPALSSSPGGGEASPLSGGGVMASNTPGPDSIKPSLILVGKRIESPTTSGEFTFTQVPPHPSESPMGQPGDFSRQAPPPQAPPSQAASLAAAQQYIEEIISLKPSLDYLAEIPEHVSGVADPELLDIPMPTVKEMVADLHRRLEDIAIQHPKIAQLITPQELGLNFQRKLVERQLSGEPMSKIEKEIIIDCPPNYSSTLSVDDPRKRRTFLSPSFGSSNFDVTTSPDMHRRRYSLPGTYLSAQTPHRRVHFAEPVESSVVEIEPRHRKERRREIPPPVYSSASTPGRETRPDREGERHGLSRHECQQVIT